MIIRLADLADLNACQLLNHDCVTDHVWQMQVRETESGIGVEFQEVRLPRQMQVKFPRDPEQLVEDWQRGEGFFVAELDGRVCGYVDVLARGWQHSGWVANLVVERAYRRRGIGTALTHQARQWAWQQGLHTLVAEATTKNYPALCFYRKLGFEFCGFNDRFYPNRDIALFFAQEIR